MCICIYIYYTILPKDLWSHHAVPKTSTDHPERSNPIPIIKKNTPSSPFRDVARCLGVLWAGVSWMSHHHEASRTLVKAKIPCPINWRVQSNSRTLNIFNPCKESLMSLKIRDVSLCSHTANSWIPFVARFGSRFGPRCPGLLDPPSCWGHSDSAGSEDRLGERSGHCL